MINRNQYWVRVFIVNNITDDQTQPTFEMTPGLKPFTIVKDIKKNLDITKP